MAFPFFYQVLFTKIFIETLSENFRSFVKEPEIF